MARCRLHFVSYSLSLSLCYQVEHYAVPPDHLLQLLQQLVALVREKRPPPTSHLAPLMSSGDYSLLLEPSAPGPVTLVHRFAMSTLLGHAPFVHSAAIESMSYGTTATLLIVVGRTTQIDR